MIDVREDHLKIVLDILNKFVPSCEVRIFGSRYKWTAKDYSDLDLAIVCKEKIDWKLLADIKEAFQESELPYRVDVLDWNSISEEFKKVIETSGYEVLKKSGGGKVKDDWNNVKLSNYVEIKHGYAFKGDFFSDIPSKAILLTPGNFKIGGGFKASKYKYYEGFTPNEYILNESDIIVTMTDLSKEGDTLGFPAKIPRSENFIFLHNQRLGKVKLKNNKVIDKNFLYYIFCSDNYRNFILGSSTGSTVKHTSPNRILDYEFLCPPLNSQKKIANILTSLDDKIELNQKMNETLESMAKAIFKEWFIDFGPVKAKAEGKKPFGMDDETAALFPKSFEESELGLIPKGWKVGTLKENCEIIMGQSPPGDTYNEDGKGIVFFQGRAEFGTRFPMARLYCSQPLRIVKSGTVLLSVRAPVGDINISTNDQTCIGRGLAGIIHKTGGTTFTYYLIQSLKEKFEVYNSEGTVFGAINKDTLSELKFVSPPIEIINKFLSLCLPFDQKYLSNFKEIMLLNKTRDLLLPKLISGEIQLKEVDFD